MTVVTITGIRPDFIRMSAVFEKLDAQFLRVGKGLLQQRFETLAGHAAMLVTVAETPEELYARAAGALRTPDVGKVISWPFLGHVVPRELVPPV